MEENKVLVEWDSIKAAIVELEADVQKNAKGTALAGVRVRKQLRALRTIITSLIKTTVVVTKERKAAANEAPVVEWFFVNKWFVKASFEAFSI